MSEEIVNFKSSSEGIVIVLDSDINFNEILIQVEKKLESAGNFFKGAVLDIKYRGRELDDIEEGQIYKLLLDKSGATIHSFGKEEKQVIQERVSSVSQPKIKMKKLFFKGINEGATKFHKGTVRSGQLIRFTGNVVVIGDVNPGAVIHAAGNIIIMGALRGVVHAGSDGNKDAIIAALKLQPTQLRIADVITRSPDQGFDKVELVPEIAYVQDERVFIDNLLHWV